MARLNDLVHRIVRTEFAYGIVDDPPRGTIVDPFRGADTAQAIEEQGEVLLKNANAQLWLWPGTLRLLAARGKDTDAPSAIVWGK